jgi:hypothetical protein
MFFSQYKIFGYNNTHKNMMKIDKAVENTITYNNKIELDNTNVRVQQTITTMESKQTKGLNRNTIDKYYTKDFVVELCLNLVKKYIQIN